MFSPQFPGSDGVRLYALLALVHDTERLVHGVPHFGGPAAASSLKSLKSFVISYVSDITVPLSLKRIIWIMHGRSCNSLLQHMRIMITVLVVYVTFHNVASLRDHHLSDGPTLTLCHYYRKAM